MQNIQNSSVFDLIDGLPVHPLAVHFAVVLIPLSAIALALLILVPRFRKAYLPVVIGALGLSVVLAYVAKESGEALASRVGYPGVHAELGDILLPASIGLFVAALAWFILLKTNKPKWALQIAGAAAIVAVIAVIALSYFVGHTGAQTTWQNRITASAGTPIEVPSEDAEESQSLETSEDSSETPSASPPITESEKPVVKQSSKPSSSPASSSANSSSPTTETQPNTVRLSAAEISKHRTATDCWSVVSNKVYDLSSYVKNHPGGQSVIEAICGKDGTSAFLDQHSGDTKPKSVLSSFLIGDLGETIKK